MKNDFQQGVDKLSLRGGIGCFIFLALVFFVCGVWEFGIPLLIGAILCFVLYNKKDEKGTSKN